MAKNLFKFISAYLMVTIVLAIVYQPVIPFLGYTLDIPPFYIAVIIAIIALLTVLYIYLNNRDGIAIKTVIALSFISVTAITFFQFTEHSFYNGYIRKTDVRGSCSLLVNKWGGEVIIDIDTYTDSYWFYSLIDKRTYIRCKLNYDDDSEIVELDIYEDRSGEFVLLSSVIMKICDDKSAQTIAQYIENNYSKVEWDYQFDDYYANRGLLNQHIMSVKKVEGSKSDSTENSDDSYTDLGPIECYISNIGDEHIANEIKDIHLYAKSYEGKSLYFIKSKYLSNYYPLTKGSWTRSNTRFNARCSLGGNVFYYVNVSLWDSSGSSSNGGSSGNVSTDRGLQPVQEWVPCPVCGNSLKVGLCQHCNGTGQDLYYTRSYRDCPNCGGMKKCPACGGNGGHYETRYR